MASDFRIDIIDSQLTREIDRILGRLEDPSPAWREIGEYNVDSTRRRFGAGVAPDGTPWAPNSETTILQYLSRYSGSYRKDGRLSKAGAGRVAAKKPLIGESKALSTTIRYQLAADGVDWGSDRPQAAMMQFGGRKAEFPHLWGDIPARAYLGLSSADSETILDILADYLLP